MSPIAGGSLRVFAAICLSAVAAAPAVARDVPFPRPRPPSAGPAAIAAPATAPEPSACDKLLGERAVFTPLPPLAGPGQCGAPDVVRLLAVIMPDHEHIAMVPPPTLRCTMAGAIADWVRADLAADARELGAPLRSIENYDSYDCRGQNGVAGAKLSEHGKANAIDIRSLKLADGRTVRLTDPSASRDLRERVRQSACARFMTVLGPGSDGYHEEHIHVDLAERKTDYRICQWDIRDPMESAAVPLPRPRPIEETVEPKALTPAHGSGHNGGRIPRTGRP